MGAQCLFSSSPPDCIHVQCFTQSAVVGLESGQEEGLARSSLIHGPSPAYSDSKFIGSLFPHPPPHMQVCPMKWVESNCWAPIKACEMTIMTMRFLTKPAMNWLGSSSPKKSYFSLSLCRQEMGEGVMANPHSMIVTEHQSKGKLDNEFWSIHQLLPVGMLAAAEGWLYWFSHKNTNRKTHTWGGGPKAPPSLSLSRLLLHY